MCGRKLYKLPEERWQCIMSTSNTRNADVQRNALKIKNEKTTELMSVLSKLNIFLPFVLRRNILPRLSSVVALSGSSGFLLMAKRGNICCLYKNCNVNSVICYYQKINRATKVKILYWNSFMKLSVFHSYLLYFLRS